MPTADTFTALGTGDGFSVCPTVINVNHPMFQDWTTASGFNKDSGGSPSAESIEESRRLAMHWFWNLHKIEANLSVNWDGTGASVGDQIVRDRSDVTLTPKDRICEGDDLGFWDYDGDYDYAELFGSAGVCALYSGPAAYGTYTPNKDDFIGYGIGGAESASYDGDGFFEAHVEFGCVTEKTNTGTPWKDVDLKYGTIDLGGQSIHVVKYASATDYYGGGNPIVFVDADALLATTDPSGADDTPHVEITGFEAYTY